MDWLIARLKEPSTWAGLGAVFAAIGTAFPPSAFIAAPLAGFCGVLAAATKEKGP